MFGLHTYKGRSTLAKAIAENAKIGKKYGVTLQSAQIFARNPRGYDNLLTSQDEQDLMAISNDVKILIHANYPAIINREKPASTEQIKQNYMAAERINAAGVVVHFPSCLAPNERDNEILAVLRSFPRQTSRIYMEIEVSKKFGYCTISELDTFLSKVNAEDRIGICIDTAHLWGAGISMANPADALEYLQGLERLMEDYPWLDIAWHLNDSKAAFNSKLDRHACFGETIWHEYQGRWQDSGLYLIVNWIRQHNCIAILESRDDKDKIQTDLAILSCV